MRFLIVDDNSRFLATARDVLESEGVDVVTASTSAQAIGLVTEVAPDVALVDIDLGDESGFDLAAELSAGGDRLRRVRVVLISAYPETEFADLISASPAVGFVLKADLSVGAVAALLEGGTGGQRARET